MSNDSSLQGDAVPFAFDLDSQAGVTHLLASVRASAVNAVQKNELRDLIFLYTNGGRDQSVRITLEQKIQAYEVAPLAPPEKPIAEEEVKIVQPEYPFGTSRPSPTFSVVTKTNKETVKKITPPDPAVSVPEPVKEAGVTPPPPPTPPSTPAPAPAPASVQQTEEKKTSAVPQPVEEKPVLQPAVPAVDSATQQPQGYDPNQSLQRIREIKSLVNDKVGNPVNLVDINNEVGREYMGALLDAMKKINNGTSALSAMKRLEDAYTVVEETIREHEKNQAADTTVAPEPVSVVPPTNPSPVEQTQAPTKKEVQPVIPPLEPQPLPVKPEASSVNKSNPIPLQETAFTQSAPGPQKAKTEDLPKTKSSDDNRHVKFAPGPLADAPPAPVSFTPEPVKAPKEPVEPLVIPVLKTQPETKIVEEAPPAPQPEKNVAVAPTPEVREQPVPVASVSVKPVPVKKVDNNEPQLSQKVSSLAQFKTKPRTPNDLPEASDIGTSSVSGDPLFTNEVDSGLQQLLSEWSIFKKSGLFGTGPKGKEHPLFLKIANLQIPLLLAGRFEGATQEVKQSITDYMNGWRYEQGIIYVQGETFEHYLRRVIRHILDLQNRKGN